MKTRGRLCLKRFKKKKNASALHLAAMATCSDDEYEIEPEQKCGGCDDQGCNGHKKEGQAIQQLVTLCKSG